MWIFCNKNSFFGSHDICQGIADGTYKSGHYSQVASTKKSQRIMNFSWHVKVLPKIHKGLREDIFGPWK